MSDPAMGPNPDQDIVAQTMGLVARHGASAVGGALVVIGAIQPDMKGQAVAVLSSVLLWAFSAGWSFARKLLRARRAA